MVISMLKIRRPLGRLIFNMGIAIPGKTVFLIEAAPMILYYAIEVRKYPMFTYRVYAQGLAFLRPDEYTLMPMKRDNN